MPSNRATAAAADPRNGTRPASQDGPQAESRSGRSALVACSTAFPSSSSEDRSQVLAATTGQNGHGMPQSACASRSAPPPDSHAEPLLLRPAVPTTLTAANFASHLLRSVSDNRRCLSPTMHNGASHSWIWPYEAQQATEPLTGGLLPELLSASEPAYRQILHQFQRPVRDYPICLSPMRDNVICLSHPMSYERQRQFPGLRPPALSRS